MGDDALARLTRHFVPGFYKSSRWDEEFADSEFDTFRDPSNEKRRPIGRRLRSNLVSGVFESFVSHLISIPLFGQIHLATLPSLIKALAWMVFTPKIVSAL